MRLTTTSNVSPTSPPPAEFSALLGSVVGCSTNPVRRTDPLIHQVRHHAIRGMLEMVAMIHPNARVVSNEGNVVRLAVEYVQRVDPPRAARGSDAVAGQHHAVMPVQVHGMHLATVVVDVHGHDVALSDHVHRNMGIEVPVDRPPQPGPATDEAWSAPDRVVETPVGLRRVEAHRGWASVAQEIEV